MRPDAVLTPSERAKEEPARDEGGLARNIRDIVEVIPGAVWLALIALALLALALTARSAVDRSRARRLEGEREQLRQDLGLLESALLPAVPERLGAVAASVSYRSAGGPAAGGDFYDVFELPGGRVGAIVGDVSGHGREALERTRSMSSTLRAYLGAGVEPRAALARADRVLPGGEGGEFATVVVAVHDPEAGTLAYAVAGHPPPIVTGPGDHEPITVASSPPLGAGLGTGLRQTIVPFPAGSSACFFTDGLLEARVGDDTLGRERLTALVAELGPDGQAATLLGRVVEEADQVPDDMAACLLRAVSAGTGAGPRIEELELGAERFQRETPECFLEACGLHADAIDAVIGEARLAAAGAGAAVLRVTIDGASVSVTIAAPAQGDQPLPLAETSPAF